METKYCSNCGAEIDSKAEICPKCEVRQTSLTGKSKIVAGLLGIFLRGLGVHKFYLGEIGWGIVYLIFYQVSRFQGLLSV